MRKNVGLFLGIMIGLFMVLSNSANAQCDNKWGETARDSVVCVKNNSLYTTYYKQKNYKDAYQYWRFVLDSCPCISANIYIKGIKIYKGVHKAGLKDPKTMQANVDTLMMVYDQRIKYFPKDKGKVLAYKAVDVFTYSKGNPEKVLLAHKYMTESIDIQKNSSTYASLNNFVKISVTLFKLGKRTNKEAFEDYVRAYDILEYQMTSPRYKKKLSKIKDVKLKNDQLVVSTKGLLNCEILLEYFTPKFKGEETEADVIKKMVGFLSKAKCTSDPLYEKALIVYIGNNPSSQAYQTGASYFQGKNNYTKAIDYYKKAIELEESDTTKADICFKISDIYVGKVKNYPAARTYAYKALKYRPNWGWPYIIIGSAYSASSDACGDDKFAKKAVYWVAVDKYVKAKAVDKDPELLKQANMLIKSTSARFPDNETAFFYGYKDGGSFTVGCWINETTTIRTIKK